MEFSRSLESDSSIETASISSGLDANRPVWKNNPFLFILSGNFISVFGDCFSGVALSLWVLQTTGSAKQMAAVLICHTAISVLFGSVAGTVADRIDRRKLMLAADLFRGSIACTLAFSLFYLDSSFGVMIVLVALSAFSSLFQAPAFHASIGQLVGKERIGQATSAVYLMDNVARISGLALAGVAIASFGGFWAMIFNSATFFMSAVCVVAAGAFPSFSRERREKSTFLKDLVGGFSYIRRDRLTRSIVILNPLLILFVMSSLMLIQVIAVKEWKAGPVAFGLLEMCIPLGYMIGAGLIMAFGSKLGHRGWWIFSGLLTLGPVFYLISIVPYAHTALPFILLCGMLFAFCTMMIQIILRSEVQTDMQGRIYGTLGAITGVAPSLGLVASSALADHVGAKFMLGAQGVTLFLIALVAVTFLKTIRTYN
ncbi:MFS transporter [Cohnella faecalis]|uniref:MFS transporter n=1 Tax=Cohnella faecalis TaxID=2315694 RepID=A0A398CJ76_9BACL|nr:MFS transporter [Cohnella faecalis]RIE02370.1 MFS transporter [Cohnella faecalis]